MDYITEPERRIPVIRDVDVLVVGGGPAGLMAAQAAAGGNHRVMLVESRSYLGGNLTILTNTLRRTPGKPGEPYLIIEEYGTPLGVEVIINHVGDCFD